MVIFRVLKNEYRGKSGDLEDASNRGPRTIREEYDVTPGGGKRAFFRHFRGKPKNA